MTVKRLFQIYTIRILKFIVELVIFIGYMCGDLMRYRIPISGTHLKVINPWTKRGGEEGAQRAPPPPPPYIYISNTIFITLLYGGLKIYNAVKIVFEIYGIWNIYIIIIWNMITPTPQLEILDPPAVNNWLFFNFIFSSNVVYYKCNS